MIYWILLNNFMIPEKEVYKAKKMKAFHKNANKSMLRGNHHLILKNSQVAFLCEQAPNPYRRSDTQLNALRPS